MITTKFINQAIYLDMFYMNFIKTPDLRYVLNLTKLISGGGG